MESTSATDQDLTGLDACRGHIPSRMPKLNLSWLPIGFRENFGYRRGRNSVVYAGPSCISCKHSFFGRKLLLTSIMYIRRVENFRSPIVKLWDGIRASSVTFPHVREIRIKFRNLSTFHTQKKFESNSDMGLLVTATAWPYLNNLIDWMQFHIDCELSMPWLKLSWKSL